MADADKEKEGEHPYSSPWARLYRWFDQRTGLGSLMHEALDEPIPGGARWAYIFGSVLLFLFISQTVTGIFLSLYYVPSADHAHTTVAYLVKSVTGGSFLRSIHAYGSSAVVITLLLHLTQTFVYGSYKGRREVLWISGCVLFGMMLAMAFTGYLLPWDQKAYFATTVGTNMASEVPWIGGMLKRFMRGGNEMGTLTLSRFFVAHVFIIPIAVLGFIAAHVYLFRKAGAAGPPQEDPVRPKLPPERFYPRQVMMDAMMTLLVIAVLGALAHWLPTELGPKANPADTQYVPRPEWYYLPIFQWLKYFKGPLAIFGIVIIPTLTAALVIFLPFYDRGLERRPWKRPIAIGIYTAIMATLIVFGWLSGYEDRKDPAIAKQVTKQREDTEEFMRAPFEPEPAASSLSAPSAVVLDPVAAAGKKVYEGEACDACHGENGVGSANGPKLAGKTAGKSAEELSNLLRHPTPKMLAGEMQAVSVSDEDLQALVAYLKSLK
ncbi:MAG: cytochrome b N-terminal domain-containing protein [Verrucomicrobiota bacterium]|nr:cytochrome b N-terminal domain-containing protein [Verrucomicrobiota bacterium]